MKRKQISSIMTIMMLTFTGFIGVISMDVSQDARGEEPPAIPSTIEMGDIVLFNITKFAGVIPDYWVHAACYVGNGQIVHTWHKDFGSWHRYAYVRYSSLNEVAQEARAVAYLRVKDPDTGEDLDEGLRQDAVDFMIDQLGHPFDRLSPLPPLLTKQIEGPWPTLGYKYYCTELVWAGYAHEDVQVDIDMDDNGNAVYPDEIYNSPNTRVFYEWHKLA
jgi:uncharacterized protein YycO